MDLSAVALSAVDAITTADDEDEDDEEEDEEDEDELDAFAGVDTASAGLLRFWSNAISDVDDGLLCDTLELAACECSGGWCERAASRPALGAGP